MRLIFLVVLLFSFSFSNTTSKNILVLHSYHKTQIWVSNIDKAINDILKPKNNNFKIYTEYMDTKRFFNEKHLENLKNLYKHKYKNIKFDIILSSDNNAFNFLKKYRNELFGNIPVSFCGINNFKDSDLNGVKNYTGIIEDCDAKSTVNTALKLFPKTKNIFIINDYLVTGRAWKNTIESQIKDININKIYSKNYSIEELKEKLKSLPQDTIVLLGAYFKDKNNKHISWKDASKIVPQNTNLPVFCLLEFHMGAGAIGGNLIESYFQGQEMSKIAKKILNDNTPQKIAIKKTNITRYMFDYNILKKFNINIDQLPEQSKVINKPFNYLTVHKNKIILFIAIAIFLIIIIISLLISIKKRKNIEEKLQKLNNSLEKQVIDRTKDITEIVNKFTFASDNALAGYWEIDLNTNKVTFSDGWFEFLGYDKKDFKNINNTEEVIKQVIYKDDYIKVKKAVEDFINGTIDKYNIEFRILHKDGKYSWTNALGTIYNNKFFGFHVDINEFKNADIKVIEQAKMASMGEMIGNIAHQWRQPLGAISSASTGMSLESELDTLDKEKIKYYTDGINRSAQYLSQTIDTFRDFIKEKKVLKEFILQDRINMVLNILSASLKNNYIEIKTDIEEKPIKIKLIVGELDQVIINILNNAKDVLKEKDIKNPWIKIVLLKENNKAIITIEDNGGGIPNNIIHKIFDPYFTTKHQSQGTGLGLHMSYKIITESLNGQIYVKNTQNGAKFFIELPLNNKN